MAQYKMIGISSARVVERLVQGAPDESCMIKWGRGRSAAFVARYFPSRKGWRLLDIRQARALPLGGAYSHRQMWKGQVRGQRYYPNEDAAVMHAMALMGVAPEIT